jgi:hypothetical protein
MYGEGGCLARAEPRRRAGEDLKTIDDDDRSIYLFFYIDVRRSDCSTRKKRKCALSSCGRQLFLSSL